mgnify:CR=1 FL=1
MRLTTIGTGTISLTPGRACAGHHVDAGAARVLLDCGSGVVHRMAEREVDWWGITVTRTPGQPPRNSTVDVPNRGSTSEI